MIPISLLPLGRDIVPTDEPFTAGPTGAPAPAGTLPPANRDEKRDW